MELRLAGNEGCTVIAIDGPAASGKSTVAAEVARRLGFLLVNSGSMFRTVTLLAVEKGVDLDDEAKLVELARTVRRGYSLKWGDTGTPLVFLGGRDVTEPIRSQGVGESVSPVSAVQGVRDEMVALQRELAAGGGAVVEGRDIGTTVFPDARLKVYLEATPGARAARRKREFDQKGIPVTFREVEGEIAMRDSIDSSRKASPLAKARDAVVIETDEKTAREVTEAIIAAFQMGSDA